LIFCLFFRIFNHKKIHFEKIFLDNILFEKKKSVNLQNYEKKQYKKRQSEKPCLLFSVLNFLLLMVACGYSVFFGSEEKRNAPDSRQSNNHINDSAYN